MTLSERFRGIEFGEVSHRTPPAAVNPMSLRERLAGVQSANLVDDNEELIPFASWTPDQPDFLSSGMRVAKNVIPDQNSYRPFKSLAVEAATITGTILGAGFGRDSAGASFLYAGITADLFQVSGATVTNKSSASAIYTTGSEEVWEFCPFSSVAFGSRMVATNFDDEVQGITIGSAGKFSDLLTSTLKPKARHCAPVRDFLVLANTNDGTDGLRPSRVWWSALGNPLDFDPDADTQSDFQDISGGGWIQKIVGGVEYGLIVQQRRISRMTYVGAPLIFDIQSIDRKRGTPIPNSVIGHGRMVFFIGDEGFFVNDGTQSYPIGDNQVDRWFWDQFNANNRHRVSSAIDYRNKIVSWAFPGEGSSGGAPNRMILYNWVQKKWSYVEIDVDFIMSSETTAYTLEGLDTVGTDMDDFPASLDSQQWMGGTIQYSAFNTAHRLSHFTGTNLAATFETGEFQLNPGFRSQVRKLRPLVDGSSAVTCQIAGRDRLADTPSFDPVANLSSIGEASVRNDARYHKIRVSINAGEAWTHAQGVIARGSRAGQR